MAGRLRSALRFSLYVALFAGCAAGPRPPATKTGLPDTAGTGESKVEEDTPKERPASPTRPSPPLLPAPSTPAAVKERWGIEAALLTLSAGGYMIDFRYKVIDPAKAAPLLTREAKRYLIHPKSGATLAVPSAPKIGALRQTTREPLPGHVYFTLFANPGRLVKAGDDVTVVLGECRIEALVVR